MENENMMNKIVSFINGKLKFEIDGDDILTAFRIGQKDGNDG
jgi:hypothetical protein